MTKKDLEIHIKKHFKNLRFEIIEDFEKRMLVIATEDVFLLSRVVYDDLREIIPFDLSLEVLPNDTIYKEISLLRESNKHLTNEINRVNKMSFWKKLLWCMK